MIPFDEPRAHKVKGSTERKVERASQSRRFDDVSATQEFANDEESLNSGSCRDECIVCVLSLNRFAVFIYMLCIVVIVAIIFQ